MKKKTSLVVLSLVSSLALGAGLSSLAHARGGSTQIVGTPTTMEDILVERPGRCADVGYSNTLNDDCVDILWQQNGCTQPVPSQWIADLRNEQVKFTKVQERFKSWSTSFEQERVQGCLSPTQRLHLDIQRLFAAAGCEGDVPAATAASQVAEVNAGRMTLGQVSDFWTARASDLNDATCDNATKRQHHEDAQMAEEHKTFGQNVRYNYTVTGRDIKYGFVSQIRTCDSDQTVLPVPLGGSEITYDECADVCAATDDCQFFSVQNNECVQELTQSTDCPEGISRAGASDYGFLALDQRGFDHTSSAMNYSANSVDTGDLSCSSVTAADIEAGTVSPSCASFLEQHYGFDVSEAGNEVDASCAVQPQALLDVYGEKIGAQGCVQLSDDYVVQNHVGEFRVRQLSNSYTVHENLTAEQCIAECVGDCVGVSHDTGASSSSASSAEASTSGDRQVSITAEIKGKTCGLEWSYRTGGNSAVGAQEHVAKFDCDNPDGDPMVLESATDKIYSLVKGEKCYLEWAWKKNSVHGIWAQERIAKFDCGGGGDTFQIHGNRGADQFVTTKSSTEMCHFQWVGSSGGAGVGNNEYIAKWDCEAGASGDPMRIIDLNPVTHTYRRIKSDVECHSDDVSLGHQSTLQDCADACEADSECEYFVFGKGSKYGACYHEKTSSAACSEGWETDKYDFYQLGNVSDRGECRVNNGDVDGLAKGLQIGTQSSATSVFYVNPKHDIHALDLTAKTAEIADQTLQYASADVINPWTFFGALGASYFFAQDETANKEAQFGWNQESYTVSKDLPMPCGADGEWSSDCNDIDESFWTYIEPPNSGDRIVLAQPGANGKPNQRIQQHATFVHDTWEYELVQKHVAELEKRKAEAQTLRNALKVGGYLPSSQRQEDQKLASDIQKFESEINRIRTTHKQPKVSDYATTVTDSKFYSPVGMDRSQFDAGYNADFHNAGDDGWLFKVDGTIQGTNGWTIEYTANGGTNLTNGDLVDLKATCDSNAIELNKGVRVITNAYVHITATAEQNPCIAGYELGEMRNGSDGSLNQGLNGERHYLCVKRESIETAKKTDVYTKLYFRNPNSSGCSNEVRAYSEAVHAANSLHGWGYQTNGMTIVNGRAVETQIYGGVRDGSDRNNRICFQKGMDGTTSSPPLQTYAITRGDDKPAGAEYQEEIGGFNVGQGASHPRVFIKVGKSCSRIDDQYLTANSTGKSLQFERSASGQTKWTIEDVSRESWSPSATGQRVVFISPAKDFCGDTAISKDASGQPTKTCYLSREGGLTTEEDKAIFNMYWDIERKNAKGNVRALADVWLGARDWKEATSGLHENTKSAAKLNETMLDISTEIDNLNKALDIIQPIYRPLKRFKKTRPIYNVLHGILSPLKTAAGKVQKPAQRISDVTGTLDSKLQPVNAWLKQMETTSSNVFAHSSLAMEARQLNKTNTLYGCSKTLNGTNEVFLRPFGWLLKETGSMLNGDNESSAQFTKFKSAIAYVNGEATSIEGDIASLLVKLKTINNILNPIANSLQVLKPILDNYVTRAVTAAVGGVAEFIPLDAVIDPLVAPLTAKIRQWVGFDYDFSAYETKLTAIQVELDQKFRDKAFDLPVAEMEKMNPSEFMKDKEKVKAMKTKVSKASKGFAKDKAKETIESMVVDFATQKLNDMTDGCLE